MLQLVKIKDPSFKTEYLTSFKPTNTAFIVSDIKSNLFLESKLFESYSFLPGTCVLRANEFYKELFCSINMEWELMSDSFIQVFLFEFLSQSKDKNTQNLSHSKSFFECFKFCLVLFLQDQTFKVFDEWFHFQKEFLFPKSWLKLSKEFFELLKSKKLLNESSIKSVVWHKLTQLDALNFNKDCIVVDLAFSIDLCEKEIFKELSRFKKVYILYPELTSNLLIEDHSYQFYPEWEKELSKKDIIHLNLSLDSKSVDLDFNSDQVKENTETANNVLNSEAFNLEIKNEQVKSNTTQTNNSLESKTELAKDNIQGSNAIQEFKNEWITEGTATANTRNNFFKTESETQWIEVKKATSQVCEWISKGISPNDIAIYAPNIEDYWFALNSYFKKESVPYKKTTYCKLIDFPEMQYLLSALRLHLSFYSFEDLEFFCFYKESKKKFATFKATFCKAPYRKAVRKYLFEKQIKDPKQKITGFEFIDWVLSFWRLDFSQELLDSNFKTLQKFTSNESLSFQSWLSVFEKELLSQDFKIEEEQSLGVSCLSFNAFHSVKSTYVFVLGLTDTAFKKTSFLNENLVEKLFSDLGFPLAVGFSKQIEKSLLWFLQSSSFKEVYLSTHLYDFNGTIHNKSAIYMLSKFLYPIQDKEILLTLSYENQQKQNTVDKVLKGQSTQKIEFLNSVWPEKNLNFFPIKSDASKKSSLSVSQIKTYNDCPFQYAADKIFYAKSTPAAEHEISALDRGSSVHELFRLVLENQPDLKLSSEQINAFIDKAIKNKENFIHEKQILLVKDYLKKILNKFLINEQKVKIDLADQMCSLKSIVCEKKLLAYWNQKKGCLDSQGEYIFKGQIDRVDQAFQTDKLQGYIVRDYKASKGQLTHITNWIKNDDFQLVFYAQAVQKGLVEDLPAAEVLSVFYSIYNDDFLAKGYVQKNSGLEPIMGKAMRHKLEKQVLQTTIQELNNKTKNIIDKMEKGEFAPQPKSKTLCVKCFYKKWCRVEVHV